MIPILWCFYRSISREQECEKCLPFERDDQKRFEEYCQDTKLSSLFWLPIVFVVVLISCFLFGDCFLKL